MDFMIKRFDNLIMALIADGTKKIDVILVLKKYVSARVSNRVGEIRYPVTLLLDMSPPVDDYIFHNDIHYIIMSVICHEMQLCMLSA